jgi:endoglucanase
VGASRAAIIVEPDALAMADCLSAGQRQERYDLIRYAVDTLARNPATAVYVDAGHVRWHSPDDMAARLNAAGAGHARGFSLNVADFFTSEDEIGYGEAISGLTNGSHYVIDTSRNGARTSARLRARLVQPQRPSTGHSAYCSDRGRTRRRLLVDQTSR